MTKQIELWIVGVVAACLLIGGYCWLQEHDQRIKAEELVKASMIRIAVVEREKVQIQDATDAKVQTIQKRSALIRTAPQAIAAMPTVTNAPLNARPLPDMPTAVAVEALPLFQELAACRVTEARLSGCTELRTKDTAILTEKDVQIKALKSKGSVWKRIEHTVEILAIGAAVGYAMHR